MKVLGTGRDRICRCVQRGSVLSCSDSVLSEVQIAGVPKASISEVASAT
jgi:hypothetical protein